MHTKDPKQLYLVPLNFPFGFKEQFLETEIKYWQGKDIVILPILESGTKREVEDIKVDESVAKKFGKLRRFDCRALMKLLINKDLIKELLSTPSILFSKSKLVNLLRYIYLGLRFEHALEKNINFNDGKHHLFYSYWFLWPVYGLTRLKAKYGNISIVCRAHRVDLYAYSQPENYMPLGKKYAESVDCIYSISEDGKKHLIEQYNIPESKVKISRLGVNPQLGNNSDNLSKSSDNEVHFLSVSYVKTVKRVNLIANVINEYAKRYPDKKVKWTHIGGGAQYDELLALSKSLSFEVELTGMLDNELVYEFYKHNNVDVFVNLSLSEGIPVSIMEAISFGVPVIATDVGGTSEIVKDEVGALLPVDVEPESFIAAVDKVLNFDGDKVINFFNDYYNAEHNYKAFVREIEQL